MYPNFMIIGSMKSGTTSLWQYLNAHPDVFMCYPKEPGYFVEELNWAKGSAWYEDQFTAAAEAAAIGEASTYYTMLPKHDGVIDKVARHLPDVKLIYIMREPVSRAVSHYWHNVGRFGERRPILQALQQEAEYTDFGRYAYQLRPWLERFSWRQFHFVSFEELKASPLETVRKAYEFLGVQSNFAPDEVGEVHNGTPDVLKAKRPLLHKIRWSPWWDRVSPLVPSFMRNIGKRLEYRSIPRTGRIPDNVREHLNTVYRLENEKLFELIGRRFDSWCSQTGNVEPVEQIS